MTTRPTTTPAQRDDTSPRSASTNGKEPRSIPEMLQRRLVATPDREAFQYPAGNGWKTVTWKEVGEQVRAIAVGLRALGLADEQGCAILSGTRIEWILIDLGIL